MAHPSEPLRRIGLDRLIRDAGGTALPDDRLCPEHFRDLLDECAGQLGSTYVYPARNDGQAAHAGFGPNPGGKLASITFDPAYTVGNGYTADAHFRTAAILHELLHVAVHRSYRQPAGEVFINYHLPALGPGGDDTALVASKLRQDGIADANFAGLTAVVQADSALSAAVRQHVLDRIVYGRQSPGVHYETVVIDILCYLLLQGRAQSKSFVRAQALSVEARDRRTNPDTPDEAIHAYVP